MTHSSPTRRSSDLSIMPAPVRSRRSLTIAAVIGIRTTSCVESICSGNLSAASFGSSFAERVRRRSGPLASDDRRSEEHTSELQSLMRISYAVFCLKKKKKNQNQKQYTTHRL